MNYHLNQQGQTVGVFPLEELDRRRKAGELTGTELVWCEGMTEWRPLDAVLQREVPGSISVPPSLLTPRSAAKAFPALIVVAVVLAVLAVFALIGIIGMRVARRLQPVLREAAAISERPRRRTSALAEASKPVQ